MAENISVTPKTLRQREANKRWYEKNKQKTTERSRRWAREHRLKRLVIAAKRRAKEQGLLFNMCADDLFVPEYCPALGTKLVWSDGYRSPDNPSVDRIIPSLGYTKGNVQIISWRANRIKSDATADELMRLAQFMIRSK